MKRPNPTTPRTMHRGRIARTLFVSKQCHAHLDAAGRPSYYAPRGTGTTYTKAKHGAFT